MSGFSRIKRVTDLLDDKAKARIINGGDRTSIAHDYVSSGSEHSADHHADDDVNSTSLSDIFFGFNVHDAGESPSQETNDSDSEHDPPLCDWSYASVDWINQIMQDQRDSFKRMLGAHVSSAVQVFSCLRSDKEIMRRNVMAYLRNHGYNAAVCKAKWQSSGGLTAGSYEFIDVVLRPEGSRRYFVDLDFASEFEIARPTSGYQRLLQCLPLVFVGTGDDLKQVLRAMSDAARRSLKSKGMHLPPWRKNRFMQNKWLGPYRRTVNVVPTSFSSSSELVREGYAVKCCAVGFDGGFRLPTTARTR